MIEQFAALYVNVLEPLGKALVVFIIIISVLWLLIMINDPQKGKDFITNIFNFMWKIVYGIVIGIGKVLKGIGIGIISVINITFTVIKDFFAGKA